MQVALTEEAPVEFYDSRTVAAQLDIPYRTLMYWVETGLIRPHDYSGRRRTPVLFSAKDVKEIGRLVQLRKYLRGQSLRDVLNTLRAMGKRYAIGVPGFGLRTVSRFRVPVPSRGVEQPGS